MAQNRLVFVLGLSVVYLELPDISSVLLCSRSLSRFNNSVLNGFLPNDRTFSRDVLLLLSRRFPCLLELQICVSNDWELNLEQFLRLKRLAISSVRVTLPQPIMTQAVQNSNVTELSVTHINGRCCSGMYSFLNQFTALKELTLSNCSAVGTAALSQTLDRLSTLRVLRISECLTDRLALQLGALLELRSFEMRNCPNITGITAQSSLPALSTIVVDNCSVPATTLETMTRSCTALRSLTITRCTALGGALSVEHGGLITLSVTLCDRLRKLTVQCPTMAQCTVATCYALQHCNILSSRLPALDLTGLGNLVTLELLCPRLRELHITGCNSLSAVPILPSLPPPLFGGYSGGGLDVPIGMLRLSDEEQEGDGPPKFPSSSSLSLSRSRSGSSDIEDDRATSDSNRSSPRSTRSSPRLTRRASNNRTTSSGTGSGNNRGSRSLFQGGGSKHPPLRSDCNAEPPIPGEALVLRLHERCPSLDLRRFLRRYVHGTPLDVHKEALLELVDSLDPVAGVDGITVGGFPLLSPARPGAKDKGGVQGSPGGRRLVAAASTTAPSKRKPRRAKKSK